MKLDWNIDEDELLSHWLWSLLIRIRAEWRCEACGFEPAVRGTTLHGHHIDHDHENHRLNNGQVLCPSCHSRETGLHVNGRLSEEQKRNRLQAQVKSLRAISFADRSVAALRSWETRRRRRLYAMAASGELWKDSAPRIHVIDEALYPEEIELGSFGSSYPGDAGIDLRARHDIVVQRKFVAVPLGVALDLKPNTVGRVAPRSTTVLEMGLEMQVGTIDPGYTGEIHAFCIAKDENIEVQRGDRIAQLMVLQCVAPMQRFVDSRGKERWVNAFEVVPHMSPDDSWQGKRGKAGLGSTGRE